MPDSSGTRDLLAVGGWLAGSPPELLAQIAELVLPRRFGDGALIYAPGDSADQLCGVAAGRVRFSAVTPDGREILVRLFERGDWFGYASLLAGSGRRFQARAVGPTTLLSVPAPQFRALLDREPRLYENLLKLVSHDLQQAFEFIEDAMFLPLAARLAKRLLQLARAYGEPTATGTRIALHLPQQDLGRMLGVSRQMVSAELRAWKARGWVQVEYGRLVLADAAALARIVAEASES
jgi:CRP/FNR family transcriptional regulator, cyclic AMP receptor protein